MSNQDRKAPPLDPAQVAAAADAGGREAQPGVLPNQPTDETRLASDALAPFVAAKGALLEGADVEPVHNDANEIEPSMAANADIEHVPESAPDQVDPGADGRPVI